MGIPVDNQNLEGQDNSGQQGQDKSTGTQVADTSTFVWKDKLTPDLKGAPTLGKFEDTPEGLQKAFESHLSLEKLLGHEKVPIPKDDKDTEGWARFSKAMGIPDKAEEYGLSDVKMPEGMQGMAFDKKKFAETVHALKLTPAQAKGLWESYTQMSIDAYGKAVSSHKESLTEVVNRLRGEWGDAYEANVELGQLVINKFSGDADTENFITATLSKDPRGVKFLAKVGQQFAENKVGEFGYKKFSRTAEEAKAEMDAIMNDPKHPYRNEKASEEEHQQAVDYVNNLISVINKVKG